jgi:hypothetical protein
MPVGGQSLRRLTFFRAAQFFSRITLQPADEKRWKSIPKEKRVGLMIDFSVPVAGMNQAAARVDAAVSRLSASPTVRAAVGGLAADVVVLTSGRDDFAASAKAAKVEADMEQALIDMLA